MNPIFYLIHMVCTLVMWVVIASVVMSWLVAFNVVNTRNPLMNRFYQGLNSLTEQLYKPIRKVIPTIYGGMDISPVIILILLQLIQYTLGWATMTFGI
jgi:YggT family protein